MAVTVATLVIQLTATTNFLIKLTSSNFPAWKCQVHAALVGLGLEGYVDGTIRAPDQFLDDAKSQLNPCYTIWYRQDTVILSALLGSCSDTIQPLLQSASSAYHAWEKLAVTYASTSRGRIISLKTTMAKTTKGNRSILEYLAEMTAIADALALAQNPISEEDLVINVLKGLGPEYGELRSAIRIRQTALTMAELQSILLEKEQDIAEAAEANSSLIPTANATQMAERTLSSHFHNERHASGVNRRSGPTRRGRGGPPHYSTRASSSGQTVCRFCDNLGHTVQQCRKLQRFLRDNHISYAPTNTNPTVNHVATQSIQPDQSWMFDSGASHHVSNDIARLPQFTEYGGPDEVCLGDGSGHGGATSARGEH
ncbi:unnamed protein product [Cuscuta europaea]|uniref:Retrotransposon Copia-like N-terminal domain-containing protein n=1 Tax=Cuscuta europaea TaxID=41803 RepID=A0A9P0ZN97_CUSEU|nr:unnamed protein product [Cuscuta europaea]